MWKYEGSGMPYPRQTDFIEGWMDLKTVLTAAAKALLPCQEYNPVLQSPSRNFIAYSPN